MNKNTLQIYEGEQPVPILRRIFAFLIDMIGLVVIHLCLILAMISIVKVNDGYKQTEQIINNEMLECYHMQEEAKIYEYIGTDDTKYQKPRQLEDIFKDWAMRHILYSYSVDPSYFIKYNVVIKNDEGLKIATYENDNLAYFYDCYVAKYNNFNSHNNDIVNLESQNVREYYYRRFKANTLKLDIWNFDPALNKLPYLSSEAAYDLYNYLKIDNSYKAGLTIYNFCATTYKEMRREEVDFLIKSSRYQNHYQVYKSNYAQASYIVDTGIAVTYVITFGLFYLLPQLITKKKQTLGKLLMKIQVVGTEGYPLVPWQFILRNALKFFSLFGIVLGSAILGGGLNSGFMYPIFNIMEIGISLFTISLIMCAVALISLIISFFTSKKQNLSDLLSKTYLIDLRYFVENTVSKEIIIKENERIKEKDNIVKDVESTKNNEYFDSSCFKNNEGEEEK